MCSNYENDPSGLKALTVRDVISAIGIIVIIHVSGALCANNVLLTIAAPLVLIPVPVMIAVSLIRKRYRAV